MSTDIDALFEHNRRWAEATKQREPGFFTRLAQQLPAVCEAYRDQTARLLKAVEAADTPPAPRAS